MNQDRQRRKLRLRGSDRAADDSARRTPRANVLAEAATPNRLVGGGAAAPTGRAMPTVGAAPAERAAPTVRTRRGIGLSGLLLAGFVLLTIARFLGVIDGGTAAPTTSPTPAGPSSTQPVDGDAGPVEFGTGQSENCALSGVDYSFPVGTPVYWSATLRTIQAPDARVIWLLRRDGRILDRNEEQFADNVDWWDLLCGGPIEGTAPGDYSFEVWDGSGDELLSVGGYQVVAIR